MARSVFKNPALQQQLEEFGYVTLPFLSPEEVEHLKEMYIALQHAPRKGFHASMHSKDVAYRRKVNQMIAAVFTPKAQELLDDYRPLVANFTVKEPGPASFFDFHLDWNMVDESQSRSITIWCPLTDTNATNGNLWVLEKSHRLGDSYRCGPGLELYFKDMKGLSSEKFNKVHLPMKAGHAVIYDHKLFHGSPPNMSNEVRIAINQAMCPAEAPAMHYAVQPGTEIMAFEVDDDFFCRVIIDQLDLQNPVEIIKKPQQKAVQQDTVNAMIG
jgi:hypothetical protein